jgi:hypothetical protein
VIVLVPTGTPFSADRQLEAERRQFGHDNNSGPAQPDRCRIALELDLLAQFKNRCLVRLEPIFNGWPGCGKRGSGDLQRGGASGDAAPPTNKGISCEDRDATLPDVGRLGGGPLCGAGEGTGQDGRTGRGGRGPGVWEVFEAPGGQLLGLNGTGPGLWRVLRRGTTAHAPNATNLASGSEDAKVRRWNPTTGQPIGQPM